MKLSVLYFLLLASVTGMAQPFTALYPFTNVNTTSGITDPTPVPTATGVNFGSFSAVGTPANANASGRFSFTGWGLGATNGNNTFTGAVDPAKYYQVTITPQANFTVTLDSITFTIQRSGSGIRQYAIKSSADGYTNNVEASINPATASLQVVPTNIFQIDDAITVATDGSTIKLTGLTNITSPISFRFYGFNAEGTGGTFSIDNVRIFGEALPVAGSAVITLNTAGIGFAATNVGAQTAAQSYTVMGENLVANLDLAVAAPFSISTDSLSFSTAISLAPADVATPKKIFVAFAPTTSGSFIDTVLHASSGATTKKLGLVGEGIVPGVFAFNFNTCTNLSVPGSGFVTYSVTGAQTWACTSFGQNTSNGVNMNGYLGSALENEDWLISPPFNLSSFNLPVLSFYSRGEFTGLPLELLVSTNYSGIGDPNAATWTTLQGYFPAVGSNVWTLSDNINLSAFKAAANVYVAFKYKSSPTLGASRWTIDDVAINNRTTLFATSPSTIDLGDVSVGASSVAQPITLNAIGYGDVTVTVPSNFEVSTNNSSFANSILLPQATTEAGTTFYVRCTPTTKMLKVTGLLTFTGTGLNDSRINLVASSYPKSETLDIVTYNMKFFGSNATNSATQPQKETQKSNIKIVFDHLNADVIGVQEVSNDSLMGKLIEMLPGYAVVLSHRWSGSFLPPDPTFPPQKVGFVYNTNTMQLLNTRVMFESKYDSVRAGTDSLPLYPTGSGSSFWSSGRLPFMATFKATINGYSKTIRVISIHAKAGSGTSEEYQRRVYDTKVLRDTLNLYYATDSVILVGDYNDDIDVAEYMGNPSPYSALLNEPDKYTGVTLPLSVAGTLTYVGGGGNGPIDHHIITNELVPYLIPNGMGVEDPRNYIASYSSTTSDHLPVMVRYDLSAALPLPITLSSFTVNAIDKTAILTWTTAKEINSHHFTIERSVDGRNFGAIGTLIAAGNSLSTNNYRFMDLEPVNGFNYYRIKMVDADGKFSYTAIQKISFSRLGKMIVLQVFPNPVINQVTISMGTTEAVTAQWQVLGGDGKLLLQGNGSASNMANTINNHMHQLKVGMYFIKAVADGHLYTAKFIKQ